MYIIEKAIKKNFVWIKSNVLGYCINVSDAYKHIAVFQVLSETSFALTEMDKSFGNIDVLAKKRTIYWSSEDCFEMRDLEFPFDGFPFFVLGKAIYECEEKALSSCKRKINETPSKSRENRCSAKIHVFEIIKFPTHKASSSEQNIMDDAAKKLSDQLRVGRALAERRFCIFFPTPSSHQCHAWKSDICELRNEGLTEEEETQLDAEQAAIAESLQSCCHLIREMKEKTYTSDEMTLSYGRIVLKDALESLKQFKEHGLVNSSTSKR